jgi:plastocyanin
MPNAAPSHQSRRIRIVAVAALTAGACAGFAWSGFATGHAAVTQRDRIFHPSQLDIARGDTVGILNDDGELLHHAYIATDEFSFDSGEQEPGSNTDIRFTKAGTFTVRCRIHPKMSLVVTVK